MDDFFERRKEYGRPSTIPVVMDVDDELVEQLKTSSLKDIAALGLPELGSSLPKKVLKDRGFDIAPCAASLKKWLMRKKYETLKKSCM